MTDEHSWKEEEDFFDWEAVLTEIPLGRIKEHVKIEPMHLEDIMEEYAKVLAKM